MSRPAPFDWNTAIEMANSTGTDRATVLGLSMISDQLDYIASLMEAGDAD